MTLRPQDAMNLALKEGEKGKGFVSPNPPVGCAIVDRDHSLLALGAHLRCGQAHGEIEALNQIQDKDRLKGATVYVTLEPCAHRGKTGSCAQTLSQYPLKEVVYGTLDPNPKVSGQGLEILKDKGIQVTHYKEMEDQCRELCEHFLFHIQNQRPFVSLKVASSLDGKIALKNGQSQWITHETTRLHSRNQRAYYDATLIGARTFIQDDPLLDFRKTPFEGLKENKIVLLDPKGRAIQYFLNSQIQKKHPTQNIYVLTDPQFIDSWKKHLVHTLPWCAQGWKECLNNLYQKGIHSLFVEGGAFATSSLLSGGFVEKIYLYQAPKIMGQGTCWSGSFQVENMSQSLVCKKWKIQELTPDFLFTGWVAHL